jgi:hypothetical protein
MDLGSDPTSAAWGLGILLCLGLACLIAAVWPAGPPKGTPDDQGEHRGADPGQDRE